jgi:hypothetical protein
MSILDAEKIWGGEGKRSAGERRVESINGKYEGRVARVPW